MQELVDIYDGNRTKTGKSVPRGTRMKQGQYVLYVLAIIEDLSGRVLITQRCEDKSWGAGWWEVTGGGVPAGEDSETAVVREVAEEVGLDISGQRPLSIYTYTNIDLDRGSNYFCDIYRFRLDFTLDDVHLQESEAQDCRLATYDDIAALAEQGIFLHYRRICEALESTQAPDVR